MSPLRRRLLTSLALDFWNLCPDEAEEFLATEDSYDSKLPELELWGKTMFLPSTKELAALEGKGGGGNWRTRQVLMIVLNWLRDNFERIPTKYHYRGESERYADTHITLGDISFRKPSEAELDELLSNPPVKAFPPLKDSTIAWNVFRQDEDCVEWVDTVFFRMSACRADVVRSLIDHDGYDASISVYATQLDS